MPISTEKHLIKEEYITRKNFIEGFLANFNLNSVNSRILIKSTNLNV